MRKIVGFIGAWGFYYMGHLAWLFMNKTKTSFLHNLYVSCMLRSYNIKNWAKLKSPWREVEDNNN